MLIDKNKLNAAFKDMRTAGLFARQSWKCCQNCGCAAIPPDDKIGYCFYHAQDNADRKDGNDFFLAFGINNTPDMSADVMGRQVSKVAHIVKTSLESNDIPFEWDGSNNTRFCILQKQGN